jgi:hypothetical protein
MPASIPHPVAGYIAFVAVKFVGYSIAARFISRAYNSDRNAYLVGATRTAIGMAAGALYYYFAQGSLSSGAFPYLAGLAPIRLVEWWLLIFLYYDRRFHQTPRGWNVCVFGTLWSYLWDLPAIFGFYYIGGVWAC